MKFAIFAALLVFSTESIWAAQARGLRCERLFLTKQKRAARLQSFTEKPLRLEMEKGRSLYVEWGNLNSSKEPIFLLMPGVNRGLVMQDDGVSHALKQGREIVATHFSAHPLSITTLPADVSTPVFLQRDLELKDFAAEIQFITESVKEKAQGRKVIPVSLSYSGALSPLLKGYETIVDVAPLTSLQADQPELAATIASLRAAEIFNPFFGPTITRNTLDTSYRQVWRAEVDRQVKEFKLGAERKDWMLEGYVRLIRNVEDLDWKKMDFANHPARRVMILAAKEAKALLKNQLENFELRFEAKPARSLLILVMDSEHAIPLSQPELYARALEIVGAGKVQSGVVVLSKTEEKLIAPEKTAGFLRQLIRDL